MRLVTPALAGWLCWAACYGAEQKWIRLESANFEMYTPGSERAARDAIRHLEMVHAFFTAVANQPQSKKPLRVVFFQDEKAYRQYREETWSAAYYLHLPDLDLVMLGRLDPSRPEVLVHEYVHALVRRGGVTVPLWFNEGLAEYYSAMRPQGNKALVGALHYARLQGLNSEMWVGLDRVVTADHSSPYYNEKEKVSAFYNESWALVHMLLQSPNYRDGYPAFADAIIRGMDTPAAFESKYGKTMAQVNRELREYVTSRTFTGSLLDYKLSKSAEQPAVSAADPYDVEVMLASLLPQPQNEAESRRRLAALAKEFPQRPDAPAAMAVLLAEGDDPAEAAKWFEQAVQRGFRSPEALRRYTWILRRSGDTERAEKILAQILEADPNQPEVRIDLGWMSLAERDPDRCLEMLRPMRSVSPRLAPEVFRLYAYAALQKRDFAEARRAAQRFANAAQGKERAGEIKALEEAIARQEAAPAVATALPKVQEEREEPPPKKPEQPLTELPKPVSPKPGVVIIEGYLLEVRCYSERPRVRIQTGSGTYNLVMPAEGATVKDAKGAAADLGCGERNRERVRVEFELRPGSDPVIHALEFR